MLSYPHIAANFHNLQLVTMEVAAKYAFPPATTTPPVPTKSLSSSPLPVPDTSSQSADPVLLDKKMYTCNKCDKIYRTYCGLVKHLKFYCASIEKRCPHCDKTFNSQAAYKKHIARQHTVRYRCQRCFKSFSSKQYWDEHMSTPCGKKRHRCDMCGKTFAVLSNMKGHRETHYETRHSCKFCAKTFTHLPILWQHENACSKVN